MTAPVPYAAVLLNLGAPDDEEDIHRYIQRLLSDSQVMPLPWPMRSLAARLIAGRRAAVATQHYRAIGGRSPLGAQTRAQAEALRAALGGSVPVRYAFTHSTPCADQVLPDMAKAGLRRVVAVPAYPQAARSTSGSALLHITRAAARAGVQVRTVHSFPEAPGYIEALADLALPLLSPGTHLVFSAHGLPARAVRRGERYLEEVARTVSALAQLLPAGTRHSLAFQSRVGPMSWIGPNLTEEVTRLAGEGVRSLVVAPISFVCENLETLYELDIELAAHAAECGITAFARVPAPGCHPAFIRELARLVHNEARAAGWEAGNGD
jgi:ferrochelatase